MASDARVLIQLRPINLVPPQLSSMTQDFHALNRLLSLKAVDVGGDAKVTHDLSFDIIEQYEKAQEERGAASRDEQNK